MSAYPTNSETYPAVTDPTASATEDAGAEFADGWPEEVMPSETQGVSGSSQDDEPGE